MANTPKKPDWKFWDWVGYSCLWVAALMLAVDTGIRQYPKLAAQMTDVTGSVAWGFAPLALISFAGLLAVIKHWPWRKAVVPTEHAPRELSAEHADLDATQKQLAEAEARLAKEGERFADQVRQKCEWMDKFTALESERDLKDARWRQLYWRIEHDVNTPDFPSLTPADVAWVQHDLAGLATPLDELGSALQSVADDLIDRCRMTGSASSASWLADLVAEYVFRPCARSLMFLRRPENTDLEPREAFTAFFLAYRRVREWIPRVAVALQIEEGEIGGYATWRDADRRLFERFNTFPDTPAMRSVRDLVRRHQQDGYPQNLNRAATEDPILKHLKSSSKDEMSFLYLFCVDELPMFLGQPETFLPNAVYNAGASLVKHRVLTHETTADRRERFCLTDTARAVWDHSERAMPLLKQCVEIDPRTVCGTGASGGGATRSV